MNIMNIMNNNVICIVLNIKTIINENNPIHLLN